MIKKVLFISPLPPPLYGAAISSEMCLEILKESKEFKVKNLKLNQSKNLNDVGKISFRKLKELSNLKKTVKKELQEFEPDLVYFMPATAKIGLLRDYQIIKIIKASKTPLLFHIRTRILKKGRLIRKILKKEKAIILSKSFYKDLDSILGEKEIFVLTNAIKNELSKKSLLQIIKKRPQKRLEIIFLSNMILSKGWPELMHACHLLKKEKIDFHCKFIGAWPSEKEKKLFFKMQKKLGLEVETSFLGPRFGKEKSKYLKDANVFVFPTKYPLETFGRVAAEAMMYALPVIATKTGSLRELVSDKRTGYILKNNSPKEIARKLILLNNKKLREKMGLEGRKNFLKEFEVKSYKKRFLNIIKEVSKT